MFKKILVVDDDADDQQIICTAIERILPSHDCTLASNGSEAMNYISSPQTPYDIVLLDLNMPLMNGFDTLKSIKKADGYKDVPVVIVSTSADKYDIERCKRLGAAHYIIKPESFGALVKELKLVLTQDIKKL